MKKNLGKWTVNKQQDLRLYKDGKAASNNKGTIYIQVKFIPKEMDEDASSMAAYDKFNNKERIDYDDNVFGKLQVYCVHA